MASGGGKRKIGHNAKRSISMANYRNSGRMLTNKKRAIAREAQRQQLHASMRRDFPAHVKVLGMKRAIRHSKTQRLQDVINNDQII